MFAYRERRLRAPAIAGAAEVQSLTTGNVEFKADLAMNARVGFETVPAAPQGANEDRADAGQHNNTGDARRELCPRWNFRPPDCPSAG
jgi:hypothetical protein